ncbi:hypothetical protein [Neisseria bacilliformis]|uniref:hypothetical protein n=1 Tax=Neisseria bacilliformis TaxID=267212 RepID=UPI0028E81A2F|nr:hypothetical protein [Neisseria bacilliformis]
MRRLGDTPYFNGRGRLKKGRNRVRGCATHPAFRPSENGVSGFAFLFFRRPVLMLRPSEKRRERVRGCGDTPYIQAV